MHLYKQLQQHFIIPNAAVNWQSYREELTQFLISETEEIALPLSFHANTDEMDYMPTLLIVGAGASNDLDLHQLCAHYSHITLLDSDSNAMQTALRTYNLTDCPQISCICSSLIGITEEHYMELCDELQFYLTKDYGHITPQSFAEHAITLVKEQLESVQTIALPSQAYDYVCCFGVHSQLLAMYSYIYHAFDMNLRNQLFRSIDSTLCDQAKTTYMNYLKSQNDRLIPQLNCALFDCARKGVWIGVERTRVNDPSQSPIEGAEQAYLDLTARHLNMTIHNTVWPFYPDSNASYNMWIAKIILP